MVQHACRAGSKYVAEMRDAGWVFLAVCMLAGGLSPARGQDIEPRGYSNAPIGVNFLIAGYTYTEGSLAVDPSLPLKDPQLKTSNAVLGFARVIDLWGKTGKIDAIAPYTRLSGKANLEGETIRRVGGTLAFPVDPHNSMKFGATHGVSARTGNNYDLVGVFWQYRWGGGLRSVGDSSHG